MAITHWTDRSDPGKYRTGRQFRRLGYLMASVNPAWTIRISGKYPKSMRNPYIVVCNHQSFADIPIVSRLPWDMKWVGKDSLFKLPVLGWMMKVARDIPVSRGDRRSRAQVMLDTKERLEQKVSVMIMPEGTRSPDGRVGEFNDGAFKLALKLGIPVLPIALDGSFDALPKSGWLFGSGSIIKLHVFDPIEPSDWENDGTGMCDHVRKMIIHKVADWRDTTPDTVDSLATLAG